MLDAVRAEAFNEKRTLFLFGSYTIGKEKLFLEVARTLKQKVHCYGYAFLVMRCRPVDTFASCRAAFCNLCFICAISNITISKTLSFYF